MPVIGIIQWKGQANRFLMILSKEEHFVFRVSVVEIQGLAIKFFLEFFFVTLVIGCVINIFDDFIPVDQVKSN